MRILIILWLLLVGTSTVAQDVLIIGDSVLGIHQNKSGGIEDVITRDTGLSVENLAQAAARVVPAKGAGVLMSGTPVVRQLKGRTAPVIIVNGGANDLAQTCRCGDCDATLDSVLSADGRGALGELVAELAQTGSRVLWVGYYEWAPGGRAFEGCRPYIEELDQRMMRTAKQLRGVTYISTKDVLDVSNPEHLKSDGIHPSLTGAGLIGRALAAAIKD